MRPHAVVQHAGVTHRIGRPLSARIARFVLDRFLLLPLGAAVAIVWANTEPESYFRFAHAIAFPVNEIGMAVFLALIAQEVFEAAMPGGALHTWRRLALPLVGAVGGVLGAAGVYFAWVYASHQHVLTAAWPIACAVDIAAGYYVLKLVAPRRSVLAFFLMLAVATDAFGLALVALRFPAELQPLGLLPIAVALALAVAMRQARVRAFWPYLLGCGTLSWWGFYWTGLHPALALVPVVPFLPHEPRKLNLFAEPPDDDAVHHAEHEWTEIAQVVLFLFGLVNAGVMMRGYYTGTWALLAAALVGRPLGIIVGVRLGRLMKLRLPERLDWRTLPVIALATSSGFTFALFFATGVLPVGPTLAQIKIGALLTVVGALITFGAARLLRIGRFAR